MANALYGLGRQACLDADIDWSLDNIQMVLYDDTDYVVSIDVDNALDDIPAPARVATSGNFATKSNILGVADAADITLPTVTGDPSEGLSIFLATGVESTSLLIANIDTATGLPVTPNGGDITVTWDAGVNKIFKL